MVTEEQKAAAQELHRKAQYYRGRFLNNVAVIEDQITAILRAYLKMKDRAIRTTRFNESSTLHHKEILLVAIVKEEWPRFYEENEETLGSLPTIRAFRNALAHSKLDVSPEALKRSIDEGVGFLQWNRGKPVTDEEFDDYEMRVNMILASLNGIEQLISFKQSL